MATSTGSTPGSCIIFLFWHQKATLGSFLGGWFWQVWACILLGFCCFVTMLHRAPYGRSGHFHGVHSKQLHHLALGRRNHAPQRSLRTKWPLPRSPLQAVALSFFTVLKSNLRQIFGGMVLEGLGLNLTGVLPFRNHAPQSSLRTKWPLPQSPLQAVASSFFRASESNIRHFWGMVLASFPQFRKHTLQPCLFPFSLPSGVGGIGGSLSIKIINIKYKYWIIFLYIFFLIFFVFYFL